MHNFSTVELVRALERVMRRGIALRRNIALMRDARFERAKAVLAEAEQSLLLELERRRLATMH